MTPGLPGSQDHKQNGGEKEDGMWKLGRRTQRQAAAVDNSKNQVNLSVL